MLASPGYTPSANNTSRKFKPPARTPTRTCPTPSGACSSGAPPAQAPPAHPPHTHPGATPPHPPEPPTTQNHPPPRAGEQTPSPTHRQLRLTTIQPPRRKAPHEASAPSTSTSTNRPGNSDCAARTNPQTGACTNPTQPCACTLTAPSVTKTSATQQNTHPPATPATTQASLAPAHPPPASTRTPTKYHQRSPHSR